MSGKRSLLLTLALTACLVALAAPAMACGACLRAEFLVFYPPLLIWDLVGVVWFLSLALHRSITKRQGLPYYPGIAVALCLVIIAFLGHIGYFGPIATLPLLVLAAAQNIALARSKRPADPKRPRRSASAIGALAMAIMTLAMVHEAIWPTFKDPADTIIKLYYVNNISSAFRELKTMEPDSMPMYRRILKEAPLGALPPAAKRLQEIGDPAIDAPLIRESIARIRATGRSDHRWLSELETIIEEMSHETSASHTPAP